MSRAQKQSSSTPFQAVERALVSGFREHVSMSDYTGRGEEAERAFRSRALAALVVRMKSDCDARTAARAISDGGQDRGIDAYAFADQPSHVWLIQAKWNVSGTGNLDGQTVMDVLDGVQRIDKEQFHWFNARAEPLARQAKSYMQELAAPVTVVFAVTGSDKPHPNAVSDLERRIADLNKHGVWLDYEVLHIDDYYRWIRADLAPKPINLAITMQRWREEGIPYQVVSGSVSVAEVAQWHDEYRSRLFELNVRHPLGLTTANKALIKTLTEEPQNFQYFNNGITIVCDTLHVTPQIQSARYSGPVSLDAKAASIVNGAQTVKSIAEAMQTHPESAAQARVDVRVIETRNAPPGFALGVTDATNRQNRMEVRDLVAGRDPVQSELRVDLAALGFDYVVKRGELPPPEPEGCTVVDAATALALARPDFRLAYRISRSEDVLWEQGDEGAYDIVFAGAKPHPLRLWRCVQTLRAVRRALYRGKNRWESRAADFAELGVNLVAHLAFQQVPMNMIEEHDLVFDWENEVLNNLDPLVDETVRRAIGAADELFGVRVSVSSILADVQRFELLAQRVLDELRAGGAAPELPHIYQRQKRAQRRPRSTNAVHVLVDASAIKEDTELYFTARTGPERQALEPWLAEDPKRGRAFWTNRRSKPLRWHADGRLYSPSGLVEHMYDLAQWKEKPKANQGTARWRVQSGDSLAWLAYLIRQQADADTDDAAVTTP